MHKTVSCEFIIDKIENQNTRFKTWDKEKNIMVRNCSLYHDYRKYIHEFEGTVFNIGEWIYADEDEHGRFVYLHCTGYKDKEDKLIFEGDIVRTWNGNITFIGYNERGPYLGVKETPLANTDQLKIIGNVYENPELLKK